MTLCEFSTCEFSIFSGRVVDTNNKGVEGVSVLVDGVVKAMTDANGSYKLTQMTSGVFTISASKEHTIFKTLKQIKISSTNPQLEDIIVERYEL